MNNSGHDFSAAYKFGRVIFLTEGRMSRYAINEMYRIFAEKLKNSRPDDYILSTGLTQMNMVAAAVFAHMHGRINLLIHKGDGYVERVIVLSNLIDAS